MQIIFTDAAIMLAALLVIVAGSEIFTNAAEHFGETFGLSEGLVGSVFAAIATALPETLVPIVAVISGSASMGQSVGTGAIIGSSFMLSTVALCLMALFALSRKPQAHFDVEPTGLKRDLHYFLLAFAIAGGSLFIPAGMLWLRILVCIVLVAIYGVYLVKTILQSSQLAEQGHATTADSRLLLTRLGLPKHLLTIILQAILALVLIVAGAKGFVAGIEQLATTYALPVLVMSLLLIPLATEMPEKVNSILWIRRRRDTLAFGNITGAMTFQGSLLPAFGVFLTSWRPTPNVLVVFAITLAGAIWTTWQAHRQCLTPRKLLLNGVAYLGFVAFIVIESV